MMMKNQAIISVKDLKRTYQTKVGVMKQEKKLVEALKGITFDVYPGEIFGLLGPNGAGKTTTIKILTTLLAPSEGTATLFGHAVFGEEKHIRPRINFIFGGERSLYWRLSGEDNLKYFADLYKIPRKVQNELIDSLLKRIGLYDVKKQKVETYSKGMKQRLQIARALLNNPDVIFLDEPSLGLDPIGARELKQIIREIADQGKTVLLTTHYMPEAEELCDRIAIIDKGKLIALDTVEGLKSNMLNKSVTKTTSLEDVYVDLISGGSHV
jgi:ABC-2 type transport system ATP-binding protein